MAERGLFRGQQLQGIDAKGRVGIPASLRGTLERNGEGRTLLIGMKRGGLCLTGTDLGQSQADYTSLLRAEERALDAGLEFDVDAQARRIFGMTEELSFDTSGRFILPPFFRAKAGLTTEAFFLGVGARFEIWNPDRMIADPNVDPDAKDMVEYYRAQRGTA